MKKTDGKKKVPENSSASEDSRQDRRVKVVITEDGHCVCPECDAKLEVVGGEGVNITKEVKVVLRGLFC